MIEFANWIAASENRFVFTLLFLYAACSCIAIPIRAWRGKE